MKKSTIYITLGTLLIFSGFFTCTWVFYSPWATVLILFILNLGSYLARKGRQLRNLETGKPQYYYLLTGRARWVLPIVTNALMLVAIIVAFSFG
jgi:hypothetical protein